MEFKLKTLMDNKNAKIPEDVQKLAELTDVNLIALKKQENEYLELLQSRLSQLKVIGAISDTASKQLAEREINNGAFYYVFRHQAGIFRHHSKTDLVSEYAPLIEAKI